MTEIAFHFNAPDKLDYACRLLRKAVAAGSRVVVMASEQDLARLDTLLWTFSKTDFLPHVCLPGSAEVIAVSPIVLTSQPAAADFPHREVLVNLGDTVPEGFEVYARVIEVVSLDDTDRLQARARWKYYTDHGYVIVRHDLKLKSAA